MFEFIKCWCGIHDNSQQSCRVSNGTLIYFKCLNCGKVGDGTLNGAVVSETFVATALKKEDPKEDCGDLNSWL